MRSVSYTHLKLFAVLRNMRDDGKSVVIITHKLHEVEELSDLSLIHISLVTALTSETCRQFIEETYDGAVVPIF